jgi:hypothetical protein
MDFNINEQTSDTRNDKQEDSPEDMSAWPLKTTELCGNQIQYTTYALLNFWTAMVHLFNTLAMVIIWLIDQKDLRFNLTTSYGKWIEDPPENEPAFTMETGTVWKEFSLHWAIVVFHFLSFVFQMGIFLTDYIKNVEEKGQNSLRFVEYSMSAPIMLVCIGLVSAVMEFRVLLLMFISCMACQLIGLVCEKLIYRKQKEDFELYNFKLSAEENTLIKEMKSDTSLILSLLHGVAWFLMLSAYFPITHSFFYSNSMATQDGRDRAPWFVYIIIWSIFALYNVFGLVQVGQLIGRPKLNTEYEIKQFNGNIEMAYVVLSLFSKTLLGWLIYFTVLM